MNPLITIKHSTSLIKESYNKLACFDLDDTLIDKDYNIKNNVKDTMIFLLKNNYIILIFSNKLDANRPDFNMFRWKKKIKLFFEDITEGISKYYIYLYGARKRDNFRKPNTGMFKLAINNIEEELGVDINIDYENSFYCGDAAGRKGDHSDCDKEFAKNINLCFYTPEDIF